jgi:hypothetical protein
MLGPLTRSDLIGVLDQYEEDLKLPHSEHYIHVVRMEGDLKLAVCLDAKLAELVHEVQYLVPDFTFKRVVGDLNEWEVAVWEADSQESESCASTTLPRSSKVLTTRTGVTACRVYCNRATKQAFMYIFDGFFLAVEKLTGRGVRFKVFDPKGNLISIHFDMEAAQVQGFALALLKLLKGKHPEQDPDVIVRYVLKLCSVHFERCVCSYHSVYFSSL